MDSRHLLIVGPCSLYDTEASLEYAYKLKGLQEKVKSSFLIVMRAYFEKPRTQLGWRGLMHDPSLDGSYNIPEGIRLTRKLLKKLVEIDMPLATEFLDATSPLYFEDMISWGCIGARTAASPFHRMMASNLKMPIGFKNTPDGNIETALEAIQVAKAPQTFIAPSSQGVMSIVNTPGNKQGHLVLRGGRLGPNYHKDIIRTALSQTDRLIVDCSHDNSRKDPAKQMDVFKDVMHQIGSGETGIRGLMLESFLSLGNQIISHPLKYGVSVTDPCLDFESTQNMILQCADIQKPSFVHC